MQGENGGLLVKPWRSAYEYKAALGWAGAAVYQAVFPLTGYYSTPALISSVACTALAAYNFSESYKVWEKRIKLFDTKMPIADRNDFYDYVDAQPDKLYLGEGWTWTNDHSQWLYDLSRDNLIDYAPPKWFVDFYNWKNGTSIEVEEPEDVAERTIDAVSEIKKLKDKAAKSGESYKEAFEAYKSKFVDEYKPRGLTWIHGMDESYPQYFPLTDAKGNTLITGTTRSGKTVLFRVLTSQIIRREETLILVDPKGDLDLRDLMLEIAKEEGRMDDLVFFHPAYPEYCHRIDPFANYEQPSQLASRVVPLIPSSSANGDSFTQFAWGVMESIASAMDMLDIRPSLMSLRGVIDKGPDQLLYDCIIKHCKQVKIQDYKGQIAAYEGAVGKQAARMGSTSRVLAAATFYKEIVKEIKANSAIDGLLSFYEHDREHASKMLVSLDPVLKSLTTGPLASLLSPDPNDKDDKRPITSFDEIVKRKGICYIGLNSMADAEVAKSIASIFMSDLVAQAAQRYSHGSEDEAHPIYLFMDEASNALNNPVIELLNKGAGAGFRIFAATQTVPDFEAALGAVSLKDKSMGNFNNFITLRIMDKQTREFISYQMGDANIRTAQHNQTTQSLGSDHNPLLYTTGYGARTTDDGSAKLIPESILNKLPDLECIANISAGKTIKVRLPLLIPGDEQVTLDDLPWVQRMRGSSNYA